MHITLTKSITNEQIDLLDRIGVTFSKEGGTYSLQVPATEKTYCQRLGENHYGIYCCDVQVADLVIKPTWYYRGQPITNDQLITVDQEQIEIAERKLNSKLPSRPVTFPNYEERQTRIRNGDYACLFEVPFSALRVDEQEIVRTRGYQYHGDEQYYPLSQHNLTVVEKMRRIKSQIDFCKSFFGREDEMVAMHNNNVKDWSSLLTGKHPLTSGMHGEEIEACSHIAQGHKVKIDAHFQAAAGAAAGAAAAATEALNSDAHLYFFSPS